MRLNPFKNLQNGRQVWAWGMYDLANQSFTLLVVTLFLPIYLKTVVLGPNAPAGRAELLLSWSIAAASAVVLISSPFLGALADFSGRKKLFLTVTGIGCAILTCSLVTVGTGDAAMALILFALANILFMFGENFLAAFLPEVSTRETVGRVSAIGWTMGYLGALICLPLALFIPGLRDGTESGFRGLFLFAGLWFFFNALPTILILREKKVCEELQPGQSLWTIGFTRVAATMKEASRFRQLAIFLIFFSIYCCGMQVIINFSGLLADKYIPSKVMLIVFVEALALISAVGSIISGLYQDKIGQRLTVQISLVIWILTSIGAMMLPKDHAPMWLLISVGLGIGLGLGLTGAASRALVGILTPAHKTAEFFALWGLGYKIANIVGPLLFGLVVAQRSQSAGMALVGLFFLIGLIGTFFVNIEKGRQAAEESEREFAHLISEKDLAAAARISNKELEEVKKASGNSPK